jgi:Cation efflux family
MDRISAVAAGSIVIGVIVLGLKYAAFVLTGSVALYSDALESTINIATAVAALIAVRLSSAPPDENHPFSELGSLGSLKILKARINPDMPMSEELKNTGRGTSNPAVLAEILKIMCPHNTASRARRPDG